jgi:hypothetical protein
LGGASIDRERWWQAEFCISALRDNALTLACLRRGVRTGHGNGFDELPTSMVYGALGARERP